MPISTSTPMFRERVVTLLVRIVVYVKTPAETRPVKLGLKTIATFAPIVSARSVLTTLLEAV